MPCSAYRACQRQTAGRLALARRASSCTGNRPIRDDGQQTLTILSGRKDADGLSHAHRLAQPPAPVNHANLSVHWNTKKQPFLHSCRCVTVLTQPDTTNGLIIYLTEVYPRDTVAMGLRHQWSVLAAIEDGPRGIRLTIESKAIVRWAAAVCAPEAQRSRLLGLRWTQVLSGRGVASPKVR